MRSIVLAARSFAPEFCSRQTTKRRNYFGASSRSCFLYETPLFDSLPANKRKRNAGKRIVLCPHASGVRDAPRRKAACAALRLRARSPAGVPLAVLASGTFVPRAQLRARLPESGAKAAACRTHRFRSQRCTSHAGRSAGRHDARAARVRTVSFRPRAPHSLRRQGVPSRKASFEERDQPPLLSSPRRSQTGCIFPNELRCFAPRGFFGASQHSDDSLVATK
jgi:hypothetical protein